MKELKDWSCKFTLDERAPLTVGDRFGILCEGTSPIEKTRDILRTPLSDKNKYDLVILDSKYKSDYELFIAATTWKTGRHDFANYSLVIGEQILPLNGPKIKVKSLLKKGTKANPPPGIHYPYFPLYWKIGLGLLGVMCLAAIVFWFKKSRKYDLALLKLASFKSLSSPYDYLHKNLRSLEVFLQKKEGKNYIKDELDKTLESLEEQVNRFLSLEFNEPLFIYSNKKKVKILKSFVKKHHKSQNLVQQFEAYLKELYSLKSDVQKSEQQERAILVKDTFNLVESVKDFSDEFVLDGLLVEDANA